MIPPAAAPAAAPSESLYQRAHLLTPDVLCKEIHDLTADRLDQLIREMDAARNVPLVFRNVFVQREIEDRIAIAGATKEQWRALQRLIETTPPPAPSPASLPPPVPLSFPSQPTASLPPQRGINGDTDTREWVGTHKAMVIGTVGIAILGFFALREWAKIKEERAEEVRQEVAAIAEGHEPPKPKSWLKTLLFPSTAIVGVGGMALAVQAYKHRKEIAAKAKEAAEKTQKAVQESAEAQEGIENARYGMISAGLLLLDHDLMPESTRISQSQRASILTGFLEHSQVQNVPMSQVFGVQNEADIGRVFGNVFRTTDERHVLFFLVQSCKKHQGYVMSKARRLGLSDEEIMQMPLTEYVDQLAEVSSTFGRFAKEITEKGVNGITKIDWNKDIFNIPQFIHNLKTDRIFMRRFTEHYPELQTKENPFLVFCAANAKKTIHSLSQQLRQDVPEEKKQEWQMFQGVLDSMHQYVQDQSKYLRQFTHGEARFAEPLQRYLDNYLTVFDTIQLYYYLQQMIGEDGNFRALKDSPYLTTFLLQTKMISMVKHENEDTGQRMLVNLTTRGIGAALGAATNIQLPEKAKDLFWTVAGGTVTATHKVLTEASHKVKIVYQEGLRTSLPVVGGATALGYLYAQTKLNNMLDAYDITCFARTSPEQIAARYGISPETARQIRENLSARGEGRRWLDKYARPGYDTETMCGPQSKLKPWQRVSSNDSIWKMIEDGQTEMGGILKNGNIGKHFDDIQTKLRTNAQTWEVQIKGVTDRASAGRIQKTLNQTNQKIIDDALDNIAPQFSKKGARTFAELVEKEPHLAEAIGRGLKKENFITIWGHKMSVGSRIGETAKRGLISRTKLFVPLLLLRALTSPEKIPVANLVGSTAVQLTPFVGTGYDLVTLATGKDQITGEEVSRLQSLGFVIIGAATDTLTALGAIFGFGVGGAVGIGARAAAFSTRAGVKAIKAVKSATKASETMAKAARVAGKAETYARVARGVQKIGIGGTLLIGGIEYALYSSDGEAPENSEDTLA